MDFTLHTIDNKKISEVVSDETVIRDAQDMLDLLANAGAPDILMYKHHFCEEFYNLCSRLLGEILQKCSNYHVRLAIVGDFSEYTSKSFRDFVYESNNGGDFLFVNSREDAISRLARGRRS